MKFVQRFLKSVFIIARLRDHNATDDCNVDFRSFKKFYTAIRITSSFISFIPTVKIAFYFHQSPRLRDHESTPGLSTNEQRHRLLLLKKGIYVAPTHLLVMLSFGNILRD